MTFRLSVLLTIIGALLLVSACGSDEPDAAELAAEPTTSTAAEPPSSSAPEPSAAESGEVCTENEGPNGNDYTVVELPADDPDGGLVIHADAGIDRPQIGVFPGGTAVITTSDPADCLALADGSVWWRVYPVGDGVDGYVNSRFLTRSPEQEVAGRAELCASYARVLDYEDGPVDGENFAPAAETSALRNLLNGPPPGVADALERISSPANDEDLALAYASLRSYVGPLCR